MSVYAVYASDLQGGLRLVTAYDLTGLYRDRDAALTRFLLLEAAVLAAAAAVTALLAARLTRPLAVLTDAGQQIAAGDYARETTEKRLLTAVGEIVEESGLESLGINAVAQRAGVSKMLIYRYFGSLEDLIAQYIIQRDYWVNIPTDWPGPAGAAAR